MGQRRRREAPPDVISRLRDLYRVRQEKERSFIEIADQLAVAALEACEQHGATRRQIADELGVGASTVQGWIRRGRQLRDEASR